MAKLCRAFSAICQIFPRTTWSGGFLPAIPLPWGTREGSQSAIIQVYQQIYQQSWLYYQPSNQYSSLAVWKVSGPGPTTTTTTATARAAVLRLLPSVSAFSLSYVEVLTSLPKWSSTLSWQVKLSFKQCCRSGSDWLNPDPSCLNGWPKFWYKITENCYWFVWIFVIFSLFFFYIWGKYQLWSETLTICIYIFFGGGADGRDDVKQWNERS